MKRNNTIETRIKTESKEEAEEILEFLQELTTEEKRDLFSFMNGIRFMKSMDSNHTNNQKKRKRI